MSVIQAQEELILTLARLGARCAHVAMVGAIGIGNLAAAEEMARAQETFEKIIKRGSDEASPS